MVDLSETYSNNYSIIQEYVKGYKTTPVKPAIDPSITDLSYDPNSIVPCSFVQACVKEEKEEQNMQWKEERRQRQEYWENVKYAKSQLYDYYGTACHFFPAAYGDLMRIKEMSPEEILSEASRAGLI